MPRSGRTGGGSGMPNDEIAAWFRQLEAAVRAVDFAAGRTLFCDDAVAFGTRASVVAGLTNLEQQQWRGIWPNIRDFTFQLDQLHTGVDDYLAWGVVPWTSTGFDRDGSP